MSILVIDATLKASVVLAVAATANVVGRRLSAAARHLVWTLAVVGLLLLPLLAFFMRRKRR